MRFTEISIKNLKPRDKKYYVRADLGTGKHGFAVCVYPSGVKSWFFIYTFNGKRFSLALGNYPEIGLAKAMELFDDKWSLYRAGKNPAEVVALEEREQRLAPTLEKLVDEYLTKHAKRFKRSWSEDERILNREILPAWGPMKAADITKRDVLLLIENILDRNAPASANNTFQIIRKMFNFAVERDMIPFTPCAGLKLPAPKVVRDRVLSEAEIKTLWENIPRCSMTPDVQRALKLILVTAQRPGEVACMHRKDIDGRWWTVPAGASKNGKPNRVFLTDLAMGLIGDLTVTDLKTGEVKDKTHIFPCPHKNKKKPMEGHALAVAVRRNLIMPVVDENGRPVIKDGEPVMQNLLGVSHFTPHDLRRTAATFMAKAGEMDEVIDAVLNHAKQGVIKVYNVYRYDKEKQVALQRWQYKLKAIIDGKKNNVVSLKKARG